MEYLINENRNNLFVKFDFIYDIDAEYTHFKRDLRQSDTPFGKSISNLRSKSYMLDYRHTIKNLKRKYKNKKNVEGYMFTILLPQEISRQYTHVYKDFIKKILESISPDANLKYFAYIKRTSNVTYVLKLIILDRHVYKTPKKVTLWHNKNTYINAVTKSFCKSDHSDAVILHKKGTAYTKFINYSDKVRLPGFSTFGHVDNFNRACTSLKNLILEYIDQNIKGVKTIKHVFKKLTAKRLVKIEGRWLYIHKNMEQHHHGLYLNFKKNKLINDIISLLNIKQIGKSSLWIDDFLIGAKELYDTLKSHDYSDLKVIYEVEKLKNS